ncbi:MULTISPECIES: winged helix-turn-helix domain-containing protein [unclassified Sphingomonas]|uniref:winged helix-turn-helix domain-containing protein n=1 Tax=unclassified Sphingomonas TaxID=196159 RepID=UPI000BD869D5|nr:MAG: hypothetical protein B7Y98_07155 [Sphingomonas sp. 32-62-10]
MLDELTIHDPAAAAAMTEPRLHGIVLALVDREQGAVELARQAQMSLSLIGHHLRRLIAFGLIVETRREPRAGRAVARYRAVARSYFVPVELSPRLSGDRLADELRAALDRTRIRSILGTRYSFESGPRMRLVLDTPTPGTSELWLRLHLTPDDAAAFAVDVRALFERYRVRDGGAGPRYILHGAIAPE